MTKKPADASAFDDSTTGEKLAKTDEQYVERTEEAVEEPESVPFELTTQRTDGGTTDQATSDAITGGGDEGAA